MPALSKAAVYYESGQSQQAAAAFTDSGDHTTFSLASKPWSLVSGYEYAVKPYGLATGGVITPGAVAGDVAVAALTAYMWAATGASATTGLLSVAAVTDLEVTLNTTEATPYRIDSITVTALGAIALVAGKVHSAFSETRDADGGPPPIPVGSIEIGQIRRNFAHADTNQAVAAAEIFQVVGTHQERYDYPVWSEDPISGTITFSDDLPLIHTGSVAKKVYARVATPIFAEVPRSKDWVPAETSSSVSSEDYYDGALGSYSSSIGQASFSAALADGVTDAILAKEGENLCFKFSPDKTKVPYQITQGVLRKSRTYGVGAYAQASFTISASVPSVDFAA
jgi:hypothetical protein